MKPILTTSENGYLSRFRDWECLALLRECRGREVGETG